MSFKSIVNGVTEETADCGMLNYHCLRTVAMQPVEHGEDKLIHKIRKQL